MRTDAGAQHKLQRPIRRELAKTDIVETDLLDVVSSIYDAALDPGSWPLVLESCRDFVGGVSAAIFAKDVTGQRRQLFHHDGRLDPEYTHLYFTKLAPTDPSNPVQVYADTDEAVITSQRLAPDDFVQSRFAAEWAAPQGLVDLGFATIERRGNWAALFGVFRHERQGPGDEAMRHRLSLLAPHVRRAITMAGIMDQASCEAATFRDLVDGLATAVLLVDADGGLVHTNHAAQTLLGQRTDNVASMHGVLRLDKGQLRRMLRQFAGEGSAAVLETTIGTRMVAHMLPLAGKTRVFPGLGEEPVAAIFIQPGSFNPPSIPQALARAFDLTPAELRVALSTLRHEKVAEVAENLGVSEATVKTHLSHIFSKTDTRRQADIVKLVAGFSAPILNAEDRRAFLPHPQPIG